MDSLVRVERSGNGKDLRKAIADVLEVPATRIVVFKVVESRDPITGNISQVKNSIKLGQGLMDTFVVVDRNETQVAVEVEKGTCTIPFLSSTSDSLLSSSS